MYLFILPAIWLYFNGSSFERIWKNSLKEFLSTISYPSGSWLFFVLFEFDWKFIKFIVNLGENFPVMNTSSFVCLSNVFYKYTIFSIKHVHTLWLCLTLCNPMDYTVHGILQARIPEWVAFLFSSGCSQPRNWTGVSCIAGGFLTSWITREARFVADPKEKSLTHLKYDGGCIY